MTPFQVIPISNVNIRSGPGESFDIINKALSGTRLIASESQKDGGGNTWYKVTDDGWVNSKYVKQQNPIFRKFLSMKYNNQEFSYLIEGGSGDSLKYIRYAELENRILKLKKM